MTIANIFLGLVIASILGSAFHFWRGGELKWLVFYLVLSWAGFWLGHLTASFANIHFINLGPLRLGPALVGTIVFLFLGHWLSMTGNMQKLK